MKMNRIRDNNATTTSSNRQDIEASSSNNNNNNSNSSSSRRHSSSSSSPTKTTGYEYVVSVSAPMTSPGGTDDDMVSVLTDGDRSNFFNKGSGRGGHHRRTPMKKRVTRYVKKKLFPINSFGSGGDVLSVSSSNSSSIKKQHGVGGGGVGGGIQKKTTTEPKVATTTAQPNSNNDISARSSSSENNEETPLISNSTKNINIKNKRNNSSSKIKKYPHAKKNNQQDEDDAVAAEVEETQYYYHRHQHNNKNQQSSSLIKKSNSYDLNNDDAAAADSDGSSEPLLLFLDSSGSTSSHFKNDFYFSNNNNNNNNSKRSKSSLLSTSASKQPAAKQQQQQRRLGGVSWIETSIENKRQKLAKFRLWQCILFLIVFVLINGLLLHWIFFNNTTEEDWSIIDTCYLVVTTFTTVGGGASGFITESEIESNPLMMTVTCVYAVIGIICFSIAFGVIGSNVMDKHDRIKDHADKLLQTKIINNVFEHGHHHQEEKDVIDSTTTIKMTGSTKTRTVRSLITSLVYLILFLALFCGLASIIGYESEWTFAESLYYVIATSCTVGFDDSNSGLIVTETSKVVAIIFIPIGVIGFIGRFVVCTIASKIIEVRYNSKLRRQYDSYLKLLDGIDNSSSSSSSSSTAGINDDRIVSYGEYLEFMLVAMNKVDPILLKELRHHFYSSETCKESPSSSLTKNDLIDAARRQLRNLNEQHGLQHATAAAAAATEQQQ